MTYKHMRVGRIVVSAVVVLAMAVSLVFHLAPNHSSAQTSTERAIAERRAQLERDLANLEDLIRQQQVLLDSKRGERVSLERDVAILDAEIKKARAAIRAQELAISDLENEIWLKNATIRELDEKIERKRESLAGLIRRTAQLDDLSLVEILLSEKTLSQFFEEYDDFHTLKLALNASFRELERLRKDNETARSQLEVQRANEEELKMLHELQQRRLRDQEQDKARILQATQGEERQYQQMIAANERSAAQIRSELFELRGSAAINLGDAIELANFVGSRTGVRPALILGVLKQETRLGEFLGNGSWRSDMHPTRDRPLFQVITTTLGMNPDTMPVSAKPGYGWGGAMGPAQFIPSTWACYGGYINTRTNDCNNSARSFDWETFWAGPWVYRADKDRLRVVRGKQSPSNPWDNQDAFLAAGILLKDNGADGGTAYAERLAAMRYFAGWANANNPAYSFYGDGVMGHADYYQRQIDALKELSR